MLDDPVSKRWGDELVTKIGFLLSAFSFGLMLLANTFQTVILATAFLVLTVSLQSPALLSLTSRRTNVPQGITMG